MGIFQSQESEAKEIALQNENLHINNSNIFYARSNPDFVAGHVEDLIRFTYSLIALNNYYENVPNNVRKSLKIDCIAVLLLMTEYSFKDLDREYYDPSEIIEIFFGNGIGSGILGYHIDFARDIFMEQIYFDIYEARFALNDKKYPAPVSDSYREFQKKVSKLTNNKKYGRFLFGLIDKHIKRHLNYIQHSEDLLVKKAEQFNAGDLNTIYEIDRNYIVDRMDDVEYKPDLFIYEVLSDIAEIIDNYLLNYFDIDLEDIKILKFKGNFPPTITNKKCYVFRHKINKSIELENGEPKGSLIKLMNGEKEISGYEVKRAVNEIKDGGFFKDEIGYID